MSNDLLPEEMEELEPEIEEMRQAGSIQPGVVQVRQAFSGHTGYAFSVADIVLMTGLPQRRVEKSIRALMKAGFIIMVGPDKRHTGRGPKPMLYRHDAPSGWRGI